jgi:hypothetical protein
MSGGSPPTKTFLEYVSIGGGEEVEEKEGRPPHELP